MIQIKSFYFIYFQYVDGYVGGLFCMYVLENGLWWQDWLGILCFCILVRIRLQCVCLWIVEMGSDVLYINKLVCMFFLGKWFLLNLSEFNISLYCLLLWC